MFFRKKLEKSMKWHHEKAQGQPAAASEGLEDLPSMEELKEEAREEVTLEKGDLPAMILAGMLTILPACLAVLLILCLLVVGFLFF